MNNSIAPSDRNKNEPLKIAIVAVHGLGGPEPGLTARRVSDALAGTEEKLPREAEARNLTIIAPRADEVEYPKNVYHTCKFTNEITLNSTQSTGKVNEPQHASFVIDTYEVYWADLSRAGTAIHRIFVDLIEAAFLPFILARQAFAAERYARNSSSVRIASTLFSISAVILTGVIPAFLLFLLTRVVVIAHSRDASYSPYIKGGIVTLVVLVSAWCLLRRLTWKGSYQWVAACMFVAVGLVISISFEFAISSDSKIEFVQATYFLELLLAGGMAVLIWVTGIARTAEPWHAPVRWWWYSAVPVLACADYGLDGCYCDTFPISSENEPSSFECARLATITWVWVAVCISFVAAWALALVSAVISGFIAVRRKRFNRGIGFWVPISVTPFVVVISIVYLGVWALLVGELNLHDSTRQYVYGVMSFVGHNPWANAPFSGGMLAILFGIAVPIVLLALNATRSRDWWGLNGAAERRREFRTLSIGLKVIPLAVCVAFAGMTIGASVRTIESAWDLLKRKETTTSETSKPATKSSIPPNQLYPGIAGSLVLVLLVASLTSRANAPVNGLKMLLDLVFDTLNYLRGNNRVFKYKKPEARAAGAPTGRPEEIPISEQIYRRYEAVLGHVNRGGYDAVILLAHSQGTAITFDLLTRSDDESWEERPKAWPRDWMLVTMGIPVRQLYGAVFSTQYRGGQFSVWPPLEKELRGLYPTLWWNLFFGTDFVGRHLAMAIEDGDYHPVKIEDLHYRREAAIQDDCIGVGGHTGFWWDRILLGHVIRECVWTLVNHPKQPPGSGS